jgi:hypothetical protein
MNETKQSLPIGGWLIIVVLELGNLFCSSIDNITRYRYYEGSLSIAVYLGYFVLIMLLTLFCLLLFFGLKKIFVYFFIGLLALDLNCGLYFNLSTNMWLSRDYNTNNNFSCIIFIVYTVCLLLSSRVKNTFVFSLGNSSIPAFFSGSSIRLGDEPLQIHGFLIFIPIRVIGMAFQLPAWSTEGILFAAFSNLPLLLISVLYIFSLVLFFRRKKRFRIIYPAAECAVLVTGTIYYLVHWIVFQDFILSVAFGLIFMVYAIFSARVRHTFVFSSK